VPAGNVMDLVTKLDERELAGLVETLRAAAARMEDVTDPEGPGGKRAKVVRALASALCRHGQIREGVCLLCDSQVRERPPHRPAVSMNVGKVGA